MITNFKIFEKQDKGEEVVYTLNTKAISEGEYEYNVNITKANDKYVLSIENTPGSWYLETLLDEPNALYFDTLSIDGNDWKIGNWREVAKELKELIPNLNTLTDIKKYNL